MYDQSTPSAFHLLLDLVTERYAKDDQRTFQTFGSHWQCCSTSLREEPSYFLHLAYGGEARVKHYSYYSFSMLALHHQIRIILVCFGGFLQIAHRLDLGTCVFSLG